MIINPYYGFVALCKTFEATNIEIVKIDSEKIFLVVPKHIKLENVKSAVHALIGEHMKVFL